MFWEFCLWVSSERFFVLHAFVRIKHKSFSPKFIWIKCTVEVNSSGEVYSHFSQSRSYVWREWMSYDSHAFVSGFSYAFCRNVRRLFFLFCWISAIVTTSERVEKFNNIQSRLFELRFNKEKIFVQRSYGVHAIA